MKSVDISIKNGIEEINSKFKNKYEKILTLDKKQFKKIIEEDIGSIIDIKKADVEKLKEYQLKGGIVGVDGSVNRKGSSYPHYIEIFKGLAKSTKSKDALVSEVQVYSPLLEDDEKNILENIDEDEKYDKRDKYLAEIEIRVALESINKFTPYAIIMDGSLIRYSIYARELWEELRYECEKKGILLIGVIEEIKTNIIGEKLKERNLIDTMSYDKEILLGRLDYGSMIKIKDTVNKKYNSAEISSIFMRTSKSPTVIGMDIIDIQRNRIEEMAELIFALTPENSRGIPIWLDIVDKEVQISNNMLEAYLETYLDRDIYERFFVDMRTRRS